MLMHFVNSLHMHFMNKIAFCDRDGLYADISDAKDVTEVCAVTALCSVAGNTMNESHANACVFVCVCVCAGPTASRPFP